MSHPEYSKSYRILNVEPSGYSAEARALIMELGTVAEKEMSRSELLSELGSYDVLIVRLSHQIDRKLIEAGRSLLAIVTATTSLDHIDVDYAQVHGIAILSLQGETKFLQSINATAEHTWALLLALVRRIIPASLDAGIGNWNRDAFKGHELCGKHLGLVGLGRIGKKVADYGQAFGMDVGAYDPFTREWKEGVWRASALPELLKWSDVLSLHVPLNSETRGLIGKDELALIPQNAVIINTSRGQLIDEKTLVEALENGRMAGGALDVIAHERDAELRRKSRLLSYAKTHDNLIITPHLGGATHESMAKTEIFMARKLAHFLLTKENRSKVR
jgi:D-3-phosphoglycerate dehydrogenase